MQYIPGATQLLGLLYAITSIKACLLPLQKAQLTGQAIQVNRIIQGEFLHRQEVPGSRFFFISLKAVQLSTVPLILVSSVLLFDLSSEAK